MACSQLTPQQLAQLIANNPNAKGYSSASNCKCVGCRCSFRCDDDGNGGLAWVLPLGRSCDSQCLGSLNPPPFACSRPGEFGTGDCTDCRQACDGADCAICVSPSGVVGESGAQSMCDYYKSVMEYDGQQYTSAECTIYSDDSAGYPQWTLNICFN